MNAQNGNSSTGPSNQSGSNGTTKSAEIATRVAEQMAGITEKTIDSVKHPEQKGVIYTQYILSAICLVAIPVILLYHPVYGLILFMFAAIPNAFVLWKLFKLWERSLSKLEWVWQREYVDIRKASAHFEKVGEKLEALRGKAAELLKTSFNQQIKKNLVRANIFLPDCGDAGDGFAFRLFMPPPLRKNMNHPQEWPMRFRPGEGATGTCFMEGQKRVTPVKDFALTDEYRDSVHPDLKWIISLPLKGGRQHSVAVLNVDALKKDIDKATLDQFADRLMQELDKLEDQIKTLPFRKIGVALK